MSVPESSSPLKPAPADAPTQLAAGADLSDRAERIADLLRKATDPYEPWLEPLIATTAITMAQVADLDDLHERASREDPEGHHAEDLEKCLASWRRRAIKCLGELWPATYGSRQLPRSQKNVLMEVYRPKKKRRTPQEIRADIRNELLAALEHDVPRAKG